MGLSGIGVAYGLGIALKSIGPSIVRLPNAFRELYVRGSAKTLIKLEGLNDKAFQQLYLPYDLAYSSLRKAAVLARRRAAYFSYSFKN
ncbi:hypothetical protein TorRG33x02_014800 [Trema orientale]|uniref:Uncharacterized protein n=1 Tax=Trema orientale TaxID=63057 RepID=A0A2P5FXH6_TREOI|nr:hypothetical protein TorRG33x02_014800 [Trema orientale]